MGEFLCDFPGELASYSAQELAKLANVSKATVSRFVRRLGYTNYEEARRHARAEKQTGSRLFLAHVQDQQSAPFLAAHQEQGLANLERTIRGLSQDQIDAVAHAMLNARKVWVVGFRSSHSFATYLQWQVTQVIETIVAIDEDGAEAVVLGSAGLAGRAPALSQRFGLSVIDAVAAAVTRAEIMAAGGRAAWSPGRAPAAPNA